MIGHKAFAWCALLLLCGCPTVDLGDEPPAVGLCNPAGGMDYFVSDIVPNYLKLADTTNGCGRTSMCHNRAHGLAFDLTNPMSTANYALTKNYLNCGSPRLSPLLTKPLAGEDGHGGGDLIQPNSAEFNTFMGWFQ
jgi:hypothetical protein